MNDGLEQAQRLTQVRGRWQWACILSFLVWCGLCFSLSFVSRDEG